MMLKALLNKIFSSDSTPNKENTVYIQPQKIYLFEPDHHELERIINSPDIEGKAPGYVYFVQEHMNGTFKIGKTKHIEKRMNLFNVKLPFENQLVFLIKSGNHHQTEVAFHKHFSKKRVEGEWFTLDKADITWIKKGEYTSDIDKTINIQLEEDTKEHKGNTNTNKQNKPLTEKQIEYAKSLVNRLEKNYKLLVDYNSLTNEDLNRLSVYFKYKNTGALNNLVKSGVLRKLS
ncbi:GIY-YIG nuclease family protein [Bacillus sp. PK3-056]|uniref:GIY-YIG nuclease family protein n=1 Tax=Niallia circulans TaxID=1397 RepID=UPI00201E7114|nr:GIY-YIG nuclease family protein [Niallia circulans]